MAQSGVPTNVFTVAQGLYDMRHDGLNDSPAELVDELEHIAALTASVVKRLEKANAHMKNIVSASECLGFSEIEPPLIAFYR